MKWRYFDNEEAYEFCRLYQQKERDASEPAKRDIQVQCTSTINDPRDVPGPPVPANLSSLLKTYKL